MSRRHLGLHWVIGIALLVSLPVSGCAIGVVPASMRVVAPVVCPSGTKESVVVARWGGNTKGGRSLRAQLWCMDAEGGGRIANTAKTFGVFILMWTVLFSASALLLRLRRKEPT